MNNAVISACVVLLLMISLPAGAEEKMRVGGSGGMIPLLTELAKDFMAAHKDKVVMVNQQSLQSSGGIKGVAEGSLEIGMANRSFKDEEKKLGLQEIEIARVGVVIGANKKINLKELSSENLCKVYDGTIKSWQELGGMNEKVLAFTKPEKDATKETIRKSIKCFKDLKEADTVRIIQNSPDTIGALVNSRSIGFTDLVSVETTQGAVVSLKLDGVAPIVENVRSGKYKLVQGYRLVVKGAPSGAIKEFINFIKSDKGAKIIEANRAVPIK